MSGVAASGVRERLLAAASEVLVGQQRVSMPLRTVAERAGATTGSIQYHFGGKGGLLLAVLQRHGERTVERLRTRRTAQSPPSHVVARSILLEFLPLDDERREEGLVAHAFEGIAAGDDAMARAYATQHAVLANLLATHLPAASSADVDLMLAAIGGIRTDLLLHRIDDEQAIRLVDQLVEKRSDRTARHQDQ